MDNETLIWIYDSMVKAVEVMKSDAEEQIKYLGKSIVIDEIALTFYNNATIQTKNLLEVGIIDQEQYDLIMKINDKLDKMSDNAELWTEKELNSNEEWENCRSIARTLLLSLEKNDVELFISEHMEW
jgi:hypothetical protein